MFVHITLETGKITSDEDGSSRETLQRRIYYASFKQVKPWLWHVEVISGVSIVELVTDKELCQVVWGMFIKNFKDE